MPIVTNADSGLNQFKTVTNYNTSLPYSSQRWRYFVENNGSLEREFIKYGQTEGFTQLESFKRINTTSNKTFKFKTARGFSIPSKGESLFSFTFKFSRSIESGEKAVIGFGDADLDNNMSSAEGWFYEFVPSLPDDQCYFGIYKNGNLLNESGSKDLIKLKTPITEWIQLSMVVTSGPLSTGIVYASSNDRIRAGIFDERLNKTDTINGSGPNSSLQPLTYSIRGGGLNLDIKDSTVKSESVKKPVRIKQVGVDALPVGTTDTWVPVAAARQIPDRTDIQGALNSFTVTDFTSEGYVQAVVQSFAPSKVTFTGSDGWQTMPTLNEDGTTIETRVDVDQIADRTGSLTQTTPTPGGNLIGRSVSRIVSDSTGRGGPPGQGAGSTLIQDTFSADENPRNFFIDNDISVVLVNTENTGDISFEFKFRENW